MTLTQKGGQKPGQQIRWRPGIVAAVLQWVFWFGVPVVAPEAMIFAIGGMIACALTILVWWAFFSRVPHLERWGVFVVMIAAVAAAPWILHPSIAGGMMGMMFKIYVVPNLCLALAAWAAASRYLTDGPRRAALVAAILAACGLWALVRTEGVTGAGRSQFAWRWKKTAEQRLLAGTTAPANAEAPSPKTNSDTPATAPSARTVTPKTAARAQAGSQADWPGFRGPHRDGIVPAVRIRTDWAVAPPVELWRRQVGPGWSSFAVGGGRLYTQEQRGEFEVVAAYEATTGKPLWTHRDRARFWESNAGPGPRGTPALHGGHIYALGATGIVNALDAAGGQVIWTRNAASDTGAKVPEWGFASSPLVVDDQVIVAASGRLAAYDLATGTPRWVQKEGGVSYSSPQLLTIGGVAQIVFINAAGATGLSPADGAVLWRHVWTGSGILQPAITPGGDLLIATSDMAGGVGTRRLALANRGGGWTVEEVWTSNALKAYFNDFVIHKGHAYGFDGSILACIDIRDGTRKWKGGRFGNGQLLLLSDQDVLLVLSEKGELALVGAVPGQFTEIARFPAMDDKTWNHPVLAGDTLLVRNGREMVAFRLRMAGD